MKAYKKPDIEFRRRLKNGGYVIYGHIYWKPFIVVLFSKVLIGRKHLNVDKSNK